MNVLVLVDIQEKYDDSSSNRNNEWNQFISRISNTIKEFKAANLPIVVLNHVYGGNTLSHVLESLKGYSKAFYTQKKYFNGAKAIKKCLESNSIKYTKVFLTGLYSNCCVLSTARGLDEDHIKVVVSESHCYDHKEFPISEFYNMRNVILN